MNREDTMKFIDNSKKFGSKLELERIKKLCELLGNPQDRLKFIHVAGTNGKGSTSVFINNILIDAGLKTGLYTSPFIYEFNERIQIDNIPISDEDLTEIMSTVAENTAKMIAEGFEHPTEFELITAAAFLYFEKKKCDIVVLEVGLGGIYDATNVINTAVMSVITSISLDHTDYLGETIEEVAKNKCGIIKEGVPVVSYIRQNPKAFSVIENTAERLNSQIFIAEEEKLSDIKCNISGNEFVYDGRCYKTELIGKYQVLNATTAITACEHLMSQEYKITYENIKKGIYRAKWPARFEILGRSPLVIADGSHNSDGMNAFVETAKEILDNKKVICVFGMLKDKDYGLCLKKLSEISDTIVVTEVDNPRRENVENLQKEAQKHFKNVYSEKCNNKAIQKALSLANDDDVVIALGSLYMMNDIKKALS